MRLEQKVFAGDRDVTATIRQLRLPLAPQASSARDALDAVYASFLGSPFTMQIGMFLFRLDKDFAIERDGVGKVRWVGRS